MPRIEVRLLSFLLLLASHLVLLAEDWPQFRGVDGNASSADTSIPIHWSDSENMLWKTPLDGRGSSSPVAWGNRVFLTSFSGFGTSEKEMDKSQLRLHVVCFEQKSGQLLWDRSIPASPETQDNTLRIQDHGYTSSTPVTDGQAVYAFFGVSGVVAFDWNGELLWQAHVGTNTAGFGSASSPVLFENLLIVNASIESKTAFAFDKFTGEEVWRIEDVERTWTTPCLAATEARDVELIINQKDYINGFDPRTGEKLWTCEGIDDYVVPVPVSNEGIIYCLGGRQNRCCAVRLGGRGNVTSTHKLWEVRVGANVTSPVYYDGYLYWASDKAIANCLNAATGEEVYRERLETRSRIYASIIRAGKHLFVTTRDQGVVVLAATPEYQPLATNVIDSDDSLMNASPAISNGHLFLRTDKFLYCIGRD